MLHSAYSSGHTGRSAVTATECSKWAERLPSRVTAVQPSSLTYTSGPPSVHHRLDREHHALAQPDAAVGLAEVRHLRILVQPPADAVPDELAHHREARALGMLLDRGRDVADAPTRPDCLDARLERLARHVASARSPPALTAPTGTVTAASP